MMVNNADSWKPRDIVYAGDRAPRRLGQLYQAAHHTDFFM